MSSRKGRRRGLKENSLSSLSLTRGDEEEKPAQKQLRGTKPSGDMSSATGSVTYDPLLLGDQVCVRDVNTGEWLETEVADIKAAGDAFFTDEDVEMKRKPAKGSRRPGTKMRSAAKAEGRFGDWILIHYKGWKQSYDEWILYEKGGDICLQHESEKLRCPCLRHLKLDSNADFGLETMRQSNGRRTDVLDDDDDDDPMVLDGVEGDDLGSDEMDVDQGQEDRRIETDELKSTPGDEVPNRKKRRKRREVELNPALVGVGRLTRRRTRGSITEDSSVSVGGVDEDNIQDMEDDDDEQQPKDQKTTTPATSKVGRRRMHALDLPVGGMIDLQKLVRPVQLLKMAAYLNISLSQVFREANLITSAQNLAYCWVKGMYLHRPSILSVGQVLTNWYNRNKDRKPGEPMPGSSPKKRKPGSKMDRAPNRRSRQLLEQLMETCEQQESADGENPHHTPHHLKLRIETGIWEAWLPLRKGDDVSKEVCIGLYETKELALFACETALKAIAEHFTKTRAEIARKSTGQQPSEPKTCAVCKNPSQNDEPLRECTVCAKFYHGQCAPKPSYKPTDMPFNAENDHSEVDASDGPGVGNEKSQSTIEEQVGDDVARDGESKEKPSERSELKEAENTNEQKSDDPQHETSTKDEPDQNWTCGTCYDELRQVAINASEPEKVAELLAESKKPPPRKPRSSNMGTTRSKPRESVQPQEMVEADTMRYGRGRPRIRANRKKDGVDLASNTAWVGEGYASGYNKPGGLSRTYYTGFRFLDSDTVYKLLDHVLLFRITPEGEEDGEEEQHNQPTLDSPSSPPGDSGSFNANTPDYYVGQIEALWEDPDGRRQVRVAWFYWPEETMMGRGEDYHTDEVLSSNEVDTNPLSSIAAKVSVVSYDEYMRITKNGTESPVSNLTTTGDANRARINQKQMKLPGSSSAVATPPVADTNDESAMENPNAEHKLPDKAAEGFQSPGMRTRHGDTTRTTPTSTIAQSIDGEEPVELELGTKLRAERWKELKQVKRLLFARKHYHQRGSCIVGDDFPIQVANAGNTPYISNFLFATAESPDTAHLIPKKDDHVFKKNLCPYSVGVADIKSMEEFGSTSSNSWNEAQEEWDFEGEREKAGNCVFCYQNVYLVLHFTCKVCKDATICRDCFAAGRQGLVSPDPIRTSMKFLHRSSHPYSVSKPSLDKLDSTKAFRTLDYLCSRYGGMQYDFELISIVRGPLPAREKRAPMPRFLYAIQLEVPQHSSSLGPKGLKTNEWDPNRNGAKSNAELLNLKIRGRRLGVSGRVVASAYGKTVEQAKALAAFDAIQSVFGVGNNLSYPVLSKDWTAWECLRLIDAIDTNGLAWDPASSVVGTKSVLECRDFFNRKLLPAWAAEDEWATKLIADAQSEEIQEHDRQAFLGPLPQPSPEAVSQAAREAVDWARKVHHMLTRRVKVAKRHGRGTAFAVVNGQIVYAPKPESFGPLITDKSENLLPIDLDKLGNVDFGTNDLTDLSKLHTQDRPHQQRPIPFESPSVLSCVVCKKGDKQESMIICDGCEDEYHTYCLEPPLDSIPQGDWFCEECMEDRAYLYDHYSWGKSGQVLCTLAKRFGVRDLDPHLASVTEREWLDNNAAIDNATANAIAMGYDSITGASEEPSSHKRSQPDDVEDCEPGPSRRRRRRLEKENSRPRKSAALVREQDDALSIISGGGKSESSTLPHRRVASSGSANAAVTSKKASFNDSSGHDTAAWASRHFADTTVATLEATNRGLAHALTLVLAQRDALIDFIQRKSGSSSSSSSN